MLFSCFFNIYLRDPNYQDPPYEPTKLLMVRRCKPIKGTPHWDRKVLAQLGLDAMVCILYKCSISYWSKHIFNAAVTDMIKLQFFFVFN